MFYSIVCYNAHKYTSTCEDYVSKGWKHYTQSANRRHRCNEIFCKSCNEKYSANGYEHICWMKKSTKEPPKKWTSVYYDIGTLTKVNTLILLPYLVIMRIICELCFNHQENCTGCMQWAYAYVGMAWK